jgi:Kef-type K+ transport system membrane component KefB
MRLVAVILLIGGFLSPTDSFGTLVGAVLIYCLWLAGSYTSYRYLVRWTVRSIKRTVLGKQGEPFTIEQAAHWQCVKLSNVEFPPLPSHIQA